MNENQENRAPQPTLNLVFGAMPKKDDDLILKKVVNSIALYALVSTLIFLCIRSIDGCLPDKDLPEVSPEPAAGYTKELVEEAGKWINRPGQEGIRAVSITCEKRSGVCTFTQLHDGWVRGIRARCEVGKGCRAMGGW